MTQFHERTSAARGVRHFTRRTVLAFLAVFVSTATAGAQILRGGERFDRPTTPPPVAVDPQEPWAFFTTDERATMQAVIDRLIPEVGEGPGGLEAGCLVFIDRQLAGDYGQSATWYLSGPVQAGTREQGPQFGNTIAERYRKGLVDLDAHCREAFGNRRFRDLSADEQDAVLTSMENGRIDLGTTEARSFFEQILANVRQGYLSDPAYGGNRGLMSWRHIGFPGARYDYRTEIARRGEALGLEPISLYGKAG